jgi:pantetheine-phosphate adenylyltransferase
LENIAVYPGSFDPITNGHVDIICRSSVIFDKVIVAVAKNYQKKHLFSAEERVSIIKNVFQNNDKVVVMTFEGLLVNFLDNINVKVIIRGLRAISDFEFEFQLAQINRKLNRKVDTIYMMASEENLYISSGIVKEIAMLKGDVSKLVPGYVKGLLDEKFSSE